MRTLIAIAVIAAATATQAYDIVYCGAPWCSDCHRMKPVIKSLEADGYDVYWAKESEFARFQASSIPVTIVYHGRTEVKRFVGFVPKATVEAYLPKTGKEVTVVIVGFEDKTFAISVIAKVMEKYKITIIHSKDKKKYNVTCTPTVIFYENGVEKYRLCTSC